MLCSVIMKFQKSPFAYVSARRIWIKHRTTTPSALGDRHDPKEAWKNKFHVMGSCRKFFGGSWSHSRHLRKLSFWSRWVGSTFASEFRKRVFFSNDSDFRVIQKCFYGWPWHEICFCKLYYDHMYCLKQTVWSYDAQIRYYGRKFKQIVNFSKSYSKASSTFPSDFKKRALSSDDTDFRTLQNLFYSFPWYEICICKLTYDHIYHIKSIMWCCDS